MSRPEKSKQTFWFICKKKHEGGVTVTVKLACDKDLVAAEYSKSFPEYDQSAYQERQQSLVILIATGDGIVSGFDDKYRVHSLFIAPRPSS